MISALIGAVLVGAGVAMMIAHRRTWATQRADAGLNDWDLRRLATRFRRRMQTSGLFAVLGMMIGVGDAMIWDQGPVAATVFWIAVLLLGVWLLLLGLGDLAAVRIDSRLARDELQRLGSKRKELETDLEQLRRPGDNGRSRPDETRESPTA